VIWRKACAAISAVYLNVGVRRVAIDRGDVLIATAGRKLPSSPQQEHRRSHLKSAVPGGDVACPVIAVNAAGRRQYVQFLNNSRSA
jgi:hypothetical protein